jgi:hypothetical protein
MAFKVMTWNVENFFRSSAPAEPKTRRSLRREARRTGGCYQFGGPPRARAPGGRRLTRRPIYRDTSQAVPSLSASRSEFARYPALLT